MSNEAFQESPIGDSSSYEHLLADVEVAPEEVSPVLLAPLALEWLLDVPSGINADKATQWLAELLSFTRREQSIEAHMTALFEQLDAGQLTSVEPPMQERMLLPLQVQLGVLTKMATDNFGVLATLSSRIRANRNVAHRRIATEQEDFHSLTRHQRKAVFDDVTYWHNALLEVISNRSAKARLLASRLEQQIKHIVRIRLDVKLMFA